jgi:NAD+ kinase
MPQPASSPQLVAIISKPGKAELAQVIHDLAAWLKEHGYGIIADQETSSYISGLKFVPRETLGQHPLRFVVILGGDGTLLAAARALGRSGVPVLGVNLGSLGFLTEVTLQNLYPALEAVQGGRASVEERSLLECQLERENRVVAEHIALNEVVIGKNNVARLNTFDLSVDGVFVSSYRADGLIVATPTGSTAYSLAAGGPVLVPSAEAFVITPVSPHSLTHRPLVVRDSSEIVITIKSARDDAFLSFDGQVGVAAEQGDQVHCRKSEHRFRLLRLRDTFFDVLRSKLKWGLR